MSTSSPKEPLSLNDSLPPPVQKESIQHEGKSSSLLQFMEKGLQEYLHSVNLPDPEVNILSLSRGYIAVDLLTKNLCDALIKECPILVGESQLHLFHWLEEFKIKIYLFTKTYVINVLNLLLMHLSESALKEITKPLAHTSAWIMTQRRQGIEKDYENHLQQEDQHHQGV
ncbi:hypothetical protein H6P81_002732 [Aristolochia fimbriata]|uniref:Uncharacterized protein n=1 Tax=Aristolochia fimbriata TaxID=158543 RepID=A0AAV7FC99_ARIFI|nr:hypothetical protein H6P81_002732 [Aristolochia fimbriata]